MLTPVACVCVCVSVCAKEMKAELMYSIEVWWLCNLTSLSSLISNQHWFLVALQSTLGNTAGYSWDRGIERERERERERAREREREREREGEVGAHGLVLLKMKKALPSGMG